MSYLKLTILVSALLQLNFSIAQNGENHLKSSYPMGDKPRLKIQYDQTAIPQKIDPIQYPQNFEQERKFQKLFEKGSAYDYVKSKNEILHLRDRHSKHFKNEDGTITSVVGAGDVHYLKGKFWKTILTDFIPSTQYSEYALESIDNTFETYYGKKSANGVRLNTENKTYQLFQNTQLVALNSKHEEVKNIAAINLPIANFKDNLLMYSDQNITVKVVQSIYGFELDYVLHNENILRDVKGADYIAIKEKINIDGSSYAQLTSMLDKFQITDAGKKVLIEYDRPVVFDAVKGEKDKYQGTYFLKREGADIYLYTLVHSSWIQDPSRVYPITIDPVVTVNPSNIPFWTGTVEEDAGCSYSSGGGNNDNDDDFDIRVGFDDGTTDNDLYHGYAKFDLSSIPSTNCVKAATSRFFQNAFANGSGYDNNLSFWYQALDPSNTDPVSSTCDAVYSIIQSTGTVYQKYDVWGTCGGGCVDYNESNNQWKDFNQSLVTRVQSTLAQGWFALSFDYDASAGGGHIDDGLIANCSICGGFPCLCTPENEEWIQFAGANSGNRPQVIITHFTRSTAPTSITSSAGTTICSGTSTTLSVNGGSLGSPGYWRWYTGSCGGTLIGTGASISVSPGASTNYFVRAEDTCGNTTCVNLLITVVAAPTSPSLNTKTPNLTTVCEGNNVSATINAGSGGTGCSDEYQYSLNNGGTWINYVPGANISTSGINNIILIRARRANCTAGSGCANSSYNAIASWQVIPQPIAPTLNVKTPNVTTICQGTNVDATTIAGSGGAGCIDSLRFSINGGTTWSVYTSGSNINTSTATTSVIVQGKRGGCTALSNCNATLWNTLCIWTVNAQPSAPTLNIKTPNTVDVCIGTDVNATITSGAGGVNCRDSLRVSINGGSTWSPYASGTTITTTSAVDSVIVQGMKYNCQAGCNTTSWTRITSWKINPLPNGSINGTQVLCIDTDVVLTLNFSVGTGPYSFTFSNGTTSFNRTGKNNGDTLFVRPGISRNYSLTSLTDSKGCTRSSGFVGGAVVTVNPSLVDITISNWDSVKCFGGNTGFINTNTTGGTPNYTYQWTKNGTNYAITQNLSSLSVGTYKVVATDNIGCKDSITQVINQPDSALSISISKNNATCNGVSNGSLMANVLGGTAPYTYSWFPSGLTTSGISNLSAGIYTVNVLDANNCAISKSDTITQPAAFNVDLVNSSITHVNCKGNNTGAINVVMNIPNAYIYKWTPNTVSGANPTGLIAVNYFVKVVLASDTNCAATANFSITEPALPLSINVSSWDSIKCFGGNTGFINTNTTGGTPNYTYQWTKNGSNFAVTQNISALSIGNYKVVVSDNKGCKDSASRILNQPASALSINSSKNNTTCFSGANGSISTTVNGGTTPYSYSWFPSGATTPNISNLSAGIYTVNVLDANNCGISKTDTITQPAAFNIDLVNSSITHVNCKGNNTGAINVVMNIPNAYIYKWTPNTVSGANPTGLIAGNYFVKVVLASDTNCAATANFNINEPTSPLSVSISSWDSIKCFGGNSGFININTTGGTPNYTYQWTKNGSNYAVSQNVNTLNIGTYQVVVTDNKGCKDSVSRTLNQPLNGLSINTSKNNTTCFNGSNGSISTTVSGGTMPYTYSWFPSGATTANVTNLNAGIYTVNVLDANNCGISKTDTITQPAAFNIDLVNSSITHVNCKGNNTGAINVVMNIPNAYIYKWTPNTVSGANPTGLIAGNYFVKVVLASDTNCAATANFSINEPNSNIKLNVASFDSVKCFGQSDGFIDITANGGTPSYSYSWFKNGSNYASSEDVYALGIGTYKAVVTDNKGCSDSITRVINQPSAVLSTSISKNNVSCFGANDGNATVTPTGGTSPYTYLWSNTQTTATASNLIAGNYFVTTTDLRGCIKYDTVNISQPAKFSISASVNHLKCFKDNTGAIDVTMSGVGPYTFNWSNSATTEDINGIGAGTYDLNVFLTSTPACKDSAKFVVTQPDSLFSIIALTHPKCNGYNNGGAIATGVGGTTPYTFTWSSVPAQNGLLLQNVGAGNYSLTIQDKNMCTHVGMASLVNPLPMNISINNIKNLKCYGSNDGQATIQVSNGVAPLKYYINGILKVSANLNALSNGNYAVEVIDGNGCNALSNFSISQPTPLTLNATIQNAKCADSCNGSVKLNPQGGSGAYQYNWCDGSNNKDKLNLCAIKCGVVVKDDSNCTVTDTFNITQPTKIKSTIGKQDLRCNGDANGFAFIDAQGGSGFYQFNWGTTPQQTGALCIGMKGGKYAVTTTDANLCSRIDTVTILEPLAMKIILDKKNVKCLQTSTGSITVNVQNGTAPYTYMMNNKRQFTNEFSNLSMGNYLVEVRDNHDCSAFENFDIQSSNNLSVKLTADKTSAAAQQEIQITASATGGKQPYIQYQWSMPDLDFSQCANKTNCPNPKVKLSHSDYLYVIVRDADTCEARDTIYFNIKTDKETFFPTGFTPNGDGTNDHFDFEILGAINNEVSIFDRWGNQVYYNASQKNGKRQGWDGNYKGKEAPYDAYVFQIETTYSDGSKKSFNGTVTVIK